MNFSAATRIEPDETVVLVFTGVLDLETVRAAEAAIAEHRASPPPTRVRS